MRTAVSSGNPCHPRHRKRGDHEAKRNGGVERSETVPEESSRRSEASEHKERGWPQSQFDFLVTLFYLPQEIIEWISSRVDFGHHLIDVIPEFVYP